ncbi:MAG: segregation/condensation protein A [Bacillota bacterium]|nr:segregation/condensation protein A [Bacillota bacterium]
MSYKVKLEIFEGPFDLLVYLIESSEMSIYDIRISEITGQYLEYISEYESRDTELSAEFLVLAATLIEIKSKMLIPGKEKELEEPEMEDPRKGLVEKLIEYKKFKQIAEILDQKEDTCLNRWYKPQEDLADYNNNGAFDVLVVDPDKFIETFKLFIEKRKKVEDIQRHYDNSAKARDRVGIRDKIKVIKQYLKDCKKISFGEIMADCEDKYEIAVTFVAMLEMMKSGYIIVKQKTNFGEIFLEGINK